MLGRFSSGELIMIWFILLTALRIHVSPECKKYLDELSGFYFEKRGPVEMKVNFYSHVNMADIRILR